MNIFDSSYLSIFLNSDPPPPMDRQNNPVKFFKERVAALVANLNATNDIIGVPAPALAEILVKAGPQRGLFVSILNDRYKFEIIPFGPRAAIEAAELIEKVKADTKGQRMETWAKVKFDSQIIAIAKAESAPAIYSDDIGMETSAKRVGIRVIRICDLPYIESEAMRSDSEIVFIGSQLNLLPPSEPIIAPAMATEPGGAHKAVEAPKSRISLGHVISPASPPTDASVTVPEEDVASAPSSASGLSNGLSSVPGPSHVPIHSQASVPDSVRGPIPSSTSMGRPPASQAEQDRSQP